MRGYTGNYVNLIAGDLRDRYETGFPILKELIQNADDAKARTMIFGSHLGFSDASNPLLKGSGLWFFNDGEFKQSDANALHSFGINSKAGDASSIGKFGLGMKSVFHLCEALFYVAWDGQTIRREGLTPWKQDDRTLDREWGETSDTDWHHLENLGKGLVVDGDGTWFLLWLPLRTKKHLQTRSGQEAGAIISRFPGDDRSGELAFLHDVKLTHDVAEMLPLLRHLERVEHRGEDNRFVLQLADTPRLMGDPPRQQADGRIRLEGEQPLLAFSGKRLESPAGWFAAMKAREEWPHTGRRDELGVEQQVDDETIPEGAVLFCSARGGTAQSRLHWAVFLPVDEGSERLGADCGDLVHSLVLHGQFFLDEGRKKIHGLEYLHRPPEDLGDTRIDESLLRRVWNQRLAQEVVLPLVLPALERHAQQQKLSDDECDALTTALSGSDWFKAFRVHVCRDAFWMRTLQPEAEPRWRLVERERRSRLRPVPAPPRSAPERPWRVFPKLTACDVVPYDVKAPCLVSNGPRQWQEAELAILLSRVDGLFAEATAMDYLVEFLESCAGPYLSTEKMQCQLLGVLRYGFRVAGIEVRRQVAAKARRLIGFVKPKKRLALSTELPETILKKLWEINAPLLLVPKGLDPELPGQALPDERTLAAWLRVLDHALDSKDREGLQGAILGAVQGLLGVLPAETRGHFLKAHSALRVIGMRDSRNKLETAVSFEYIERLQEVGTLFIYAEGLGEARLGVAPLLARAIPDAEVCLVRARTYRELFPNDGSEGIPAASDGRACLSALGRQTTGRLGGLAERLALLKRANDPGTDASARRGLRLLLHGSLDHRTDDGARLWIGRYGQHGAWKRLWAAIHDGRQWSLVPEELANAIPRTRWDQANIAEIEAGMLIGELQRTGQSIETPAEFSVEERDEILSRVEHKDFWRRLPLHTTLAGNPVSATRERVYLASPTEYLEDSLAREAILIAPSENTIVAGQQKRRLHLLDDRARIEIALGNEDPSIYWRSIMDALSRLPSSIPEDLRALLQSRAWLPTTHDTPVKPEDVIDLRESLGDEAHRLVAEHRNAHGPCFAVPAELDDAVRGHRAWQRLCDIGFSSRVAALERLGLLLEDLPRYHVGEWPTPPELGALELLARYDGLPGWRLLEMAVAAGSFDLRTAWARLGPALSEEIDAQRLVAVLNWLSEDDDQWELRKLLYNIYLEQLARLGLDASVNLANLRLASADRQWRKAAELCAGAHGVVRAKLLDQKQEAILGDLVCRQGSGPVGEQADAPGVLPYALFQLARDSAPEVLRDYFRAWDSSFVPRPMIGVVLGLLGPSVRELSTEYLHPHSFDWLVGELPWRDPEGTPQRQALALTKAGGNVVPALELPQAGVQVETGEDVEVTSLLGRRIRVPLDQETPTLLAGALNWYWHGGYEVMIPLRHIETDRLEAERLSDLLRATAEQLYRHVYNQPDVDFGPLWKELDRSDQLEIGIARRLILDHIPFYLRQLSVRCGGIEKQLAICDLRRRRIAEAEADGQSAETGRKELNQALEELADRIDRSPDEQRAVVQAVKSKLEQYQYELSSIPLELFQNADDATVELGQFRAHPSAVCDAPAAARRFVVEEREDGLAFLHWGRPVNARGPVGFGGERRGYDRDLEKMLILSATDKRGDDGVTGRFGLGFKSVLLACEQPRILSGRLGVRVVSGILPQPWNGGQEARRRLTGLGTDPKLPGTLIDLPGVQGELRDRVLERFRQLSGILCVFGRAIRTITCVAASESMWRWQPREICPGVEVGELDLAGDWGSRTTALCVRTDSGSLLMAMGPQGFRPLPDAVPTLWVTAPTWELAAVGFAINGSFDLDAGRGRLAGSTANNLDSARGIGGDAGDALGALLKRSREDWDSVRAALGLAADLDALDFWESIWFGLTTGWMRHSPSDGAQDLAREVALGALARLSECPRAVPNGLNGSLRGFADVGEIRYELSGMLLQEDVSAELGFWARFTTRFSEHNCVSREIGNILRQANLAKPRTVGLSTLVDMLEHFKVQPADAEVLGWVQLLTKDASDWKSDDLQEQLDERLFRSEAEEWVEPRTLLAHHGADLDADEPGRHALAPPECRLHADYYVKRDDTWPAAAFFRVCRQYMDAPAEKIAQWVLDADSVDARLTALEYLADGELGGLVAEQVRDQGWLDSALYDPTLMEGLTAEQVDKLRRRLISVTRLEWAVDAVEPESVESISPLVDLPTALNRLYQWWLKEREKRAEEYRNRLYPQRLNLIPDPETGRIDQSSWLMLLALGSFQSMGGTQEEQHRNFIRTCQQRGWWDVFTASDPKEEPEKWMNIIEEYAEAQHDDEKWAQWLAQFPKLYRLRRWLADYVTLFLSIDRFQESFTQDAILAPRSNPYFQGGGIDPPPLSRTLKVGFYLIVRELLNHGVIDNPLAVPHAYAPIERVQTFFRAFDAEVFTSEDIHQILKDHLGEDGAAFSGDYDIPLRIISSNDSLRHQLLE